MSEMNKMQKPLQMIDEIITIFNNTNSAQMEQDDQTKDSEIASPPPPKKSKNRANKR